MKWFEPSFYASENLKCDPVLTDYMNPNIKWSDPSEYTLHNKIGDGRYSEVYSATHTPTKRSCVVKILKMVRKTKINREIVVLRKLQNCPHIIKLVDMAKDPVSKVSCLVFESSSKTDFYLWKDRASDFEVRFYMHALLSALQYAHSKGVIHRDIKPQNMILDTTNKTLKVIDWGLAEFYLPGLCLPTRVATRYYKAPELLLNYPYYHYSLDMWSFGCILASVILKKYPFFCGKDNNDQLRKIVRVMGSPGLLRVVDKYGLKLPISGLEGQSSVSLSHFSGPLATCEAIDLIEKCLDYDYDTRISSSEALSHPYFEPVEDFYWKLSRRGISAFPETSYQYSLALSILLDHT